MSLVHNERVKLAANALDRASTACLAVGVFGPFVATLYGFGASGSGPPVLMLLLGSAVWLSAAAASHVGARRFLGRLQ